MIEAYTAADVRAAEAPLLAAERGFHGGLMHRAATALAGAVREELLAGGGRVAGGAGVAASPAVPPSPAEVAASLGSRFDWGRNGRELAEHLRRCADLQGKTILA